MSFHSTVSPIRFENNQLKLLDQRYLPARLDDLVCDTLEQAAQAITDLVVRGAPAIGITAAYGVYLGYLQAQQDVTYDFEQALTRLRNARPTAVNLAWAVQQQQQLLTKNVGLSPAAMAEKLLDNAQAIHQQDLQDNIAMGDFGAALIEAGSRVLTHCNAGALATAGYGTALGVIRSAWSQQRLERVYASETRPWLQGLRLTAWELAHDEIPVTLIVEGAASSLFALQMIDWVIVGADRICANGDVVNKVGTANLAILARHYGVKVMVAAPLNTIDMATESGDLVEIETRAASEILAQNYAGNDYVSAWNPVFDVTPAALVSAIVTEKGVVLQPDSAKMQALFD
ncbi:MAG: S-methyl-5-thioribose-1-phosphate isomerase [Gammaproteobacteria bacterium]|nr:S-methyl-5-thioribose-1-phosphate isomerase [Gammaproteobacteria bacterium]MBL6998782.1 S-methyl-5-thioribose-1-phosphate isomerase [Gammaproteobacteria bacterium]